MSTALKLEPGLELRDASGRTLGVFTPPEMIHDLEAERDQLREQLAKLQAECNEYKRALFALTREEVTFTREELAEMDAHGLTLDEIIAEIEPIARGKKHG